jgi:prolyl-tRNA synthetase
VYRDFVENDLAIPVIPGRKSEAEKFPGADATYTIEALMPDGRALQSGTSHNLGQNFAKAFDISFQDMDGERRFAWTTSWGLSTRTVGALIMVHGDDGGMIMPPVVAPTQAVILPIWGRKPEERPAIREAADRLRRSLLDAGLRVEVDWSEEKQIGWKHNEWTLKGVPVRIELGPRDVADEQAVMVRRDDPNPRPEKRAVAWSGMAAALRETLDSIQANLFERAAALRTAKTTSVSTFEELSAIVDGSRGFINAHWCGSAECEATIKTETGATIRCLPLNAPAEDGQCIVDGRPSAARVVFARAY